MYYTTLRRCFWYIQNTVYVYDASYGSDTQHCAAVSLLLCFSHTSTLAAQSDIVYRGCHYIYITIVPREFAKTGCVFYPVGCMHRGLLLLLHKSRQNLPSSSSATASNINNKNSKDIHQAPVPSTSLCYYTARAIKHPVARHRFPLTFSSITLFRRLAAFSSSYRCPVTDSLVQLHPLPH